MKYKYVQSEIPRAHTQTHSQKTFNLLLAKHIHTTRGTRDRAELNVLHPDDVRQRALLKYKATVKRYSRVLASIICYLLLCFERRFMRATTIARFVRGHYINLWYE